MLVPVAVKTPAVSDQSNYNGIQSPSGPTTVIVSKASASQEPCTSSPNEQQTLEAPDGIAAMPPYLAS